MKKFMTVVLGAVCWTALASFPTNFMLSDFTFVRPKSWRWVPIELVRPAQRLILTNTACDNSTYVLMIHYATTNAQGSPAASTQRWENQFVAPLSRTDAKVVGKHRVTFVEVEGTHLERNKYSSDYALLGAVIEDVKGNIVTKMVGPKSSVSGAKSEFREMIESALRDGETF